MQTTALVILLLLTSGLFAKLPVYFENFENLTTASNDWSINSSYGWEIGKPTYPSGPEAVWGDNVAGLRLTQSTSSGSFTLTSPQITLPTSSNLQLDFNYWSRLYNSNELQVNIYTAGTWKTIISTLSSNTSNQWKRVSYDLSLYAGTNIKLRFITNVSYSSYPYPGAYIDNIIITADPSYTLHSGITQSGTMHPSNVRNNVTRTSIYATPLNGHVFDQWTSKQGATFGDSKQSATTVTLSATDTITPLFKVAPMTPLTETPETLHFTNNAFDSNASNGIWTTFTAPKAGRYRFNYDATTTTTIYSVAVYSSSLLSTPTPNYTSVTNFGSNGITADSAGHTFYFNTIASTTSSAYANRYIKLSVKPEVTLTLAIAGSGAVGAVAPSTTVFSSGDSSQVTALPQFGWEFERWSVDTVDSKTKATIRKPITSTTYVVVDSSTTMTAHFTHKPIDNTLLATNEPFNFKDDAKDDDDFVFFKYTAPTNGDYVVTYQSNSIFADTLIVYSDSLYTNILSKNVCSCPILFSSKLSLTLDLTYYIKIAPKKGSTPDRDFTISADTSVTVAIGPTTHGSAEFNPTGLHNDTVAISDDDILTITAIPNLSFTFSSWVSSKELATSFNDEMDNPTFFITTEDAIITPLFTYEEPHIFNTPDTIFSFAEDAFEGNYSKGVLIKYPIVDSGYSLLTFEDTTSSNRIFTVLEASDSTFLTALKGKSSSNTVILPHFTTQIKDSTYYRVFASTTALDSFTITAEKAVGIRTFVNGSPALGSININPTYITYEGPLSDTIVALPKEEVTLTADAIDGFSFSHWSTAYASPIAFDTTGKAVTLSTDSSISVTAHFKRTTPHVITDSAQTYNYTNDASDQNWDDGCYFIYRAPTTGEYELLLNNYGKNSSKYLYHYTDTTYTTTASSYTRRTSLIIKSLTATTKDQAFYFKVKPSSGDTALNFEIQALRKLTIALTTDTTKATGTVQNITVSHSQGDTIPIHAYPSKGHGFDKWIVISGNPTVIDSTDPNTEIILGDQHITLKATFKLDSINTAHEKPQEYQYYNDSKKNLYTQEGIWFKYQVQIPGPQLISITSNDDTYNRFVYYGLDSTFSLPDSVEIKQDGSFYHSFSGVKGEIHYFRLTTNASSYRDTFILKAQKSSAITTTATAGGSLQYKPTIEDDAALKPEDEFFLTTPLSFVATPETGYQFSHWEVTGLGSIGDQYSTATIIIPITDINVTAHFKETDKFTITTKPLRYNYTDHAAAGDPRNGVWFTFTAPHTAKYIVTIDDPSEEMLSDKIFYHYSDSTFTSYIGKESGIKDEDHTFEALAGETYYFMATVKKAEEYNKDFIIFIKGRYSAFTLYSTSFEPEYTPIGASKPLNFRATGSWEMGPASLDAGPDETFDGVQLAGTTINGPYGNTVSDSLRVDFLILPEFDDIELSFAHWFEAEENRDIGRVMVKENSATEWEKVSSSNSSKTKWNIRTIDLGDYAGDTISLLFVFDSDDILTFDGWYIDDIAIALMMDDTIGPLGESSIDPTTIPIIPGGPNDPSVISGEAGTGNPGDTETPTGPAAIPPRGSGGFHPDPNGGEWVTIGLDTVAHIDTTRGDTLPLNKEGLPSIQAIKDSIAVLDSIAPITPHFSSRFSSLSIIPHGTSTIGVPIHARLITLYSLDGSVVYHSPINGAQESIFEIPMSVRTGSILFMEIEE
ncbi:MAG: hypothetical protein OCD01_10710 [Fibrobacterales bacterium]